MQFSNWKTEYKQSCESYGGTNDKHLFQAHFLFEVTSEDFVFPSIKLYGSGANLVLKTAVGDRIQIQRDLIRGGKYQLFHIQTENGKCYAYDIEWGPQSCISGKLKNDHGGIKLISENVLITR